MSMEVKVFPETKNMNLTSEQTGDQVMLLFLVDDHIKQLENKSYKYAAEFTKNFLKLKHEILYFVF